jgi:multimeric flavodoxin WrbA
MKIVSILGSPRTKGNTATVIGFFEKIVGESHEVDRINIVSHKVNGCLGCHTCQKTHDKPGCIQKDEVGWIFERMMQSDSLIYASPLYAWNFPSQMKALIDRHFCLVKGYGTPSRKSLLEGKRVALLVTCDRPIPNNADLIQGVFDRVSDYCKCKVVGKYVVPFCMNPESIQVTGREVANKMADDILGK